MTILIAVLMWIVSSFGLVPDSHTIETRVWGNYGPIEINNVETFYKMYMGDSRIEPYDTCFNFITLIDFTNDDTPIILIERDCQAVEHSHMTTYHFSQWGIERVEF